MSATSLASFAMIGSGVCAGAISAYHETAEKPGRSPASATVGMSGIVGLRSRLATPSARSSPLWISCLALESCANVSVISPLRTSVSAGPSPR
jgi:hypothetical protein